MNLFLYNVIFNILVYISKKLNELNYFKKLVESKTIET